MSRFVNDEDTPDILSQLSDEIEDPALDFSDGEEEIMNVSDQDHNSDTEQEADLDSKIFEDDNEREFIFGRDGRTMWSTTDFSKLTLRISRHGLIYGWKFMGCNSLPVLHDSVFIGRITKRSTTSPLASAEFTTQDLPRESAVTHTMDIACPSKLMTNDGGCGRWLKRSLLDPGTRNECNTPNPPPYEIKAKKSDFFTFNQYYQTKLQLSNPAHRETCAVHDQHRF
ncbi:uncharacterized protein [Anabrus simplex]|uniref:uncharacterized protein n=1 Tax=Anabrus simplex TaxID=316456 RepID=UPI0035A2683C